MQKEQVFTSRKSNKNICSLMIKSLFKEKNSIISQVQQIDT